MDKFLPNAHPTNGRKARCRACATAQSIRIHREGPANKTAEQRFMEKIARDPSSECWKWTSIKGSTGYPLFQGDKRKLVSAHRWSYEHFRAPIPEGMEIDHKCRERACVNPAHLEVVTRVENLRRAGNPIIMQKYRTHCPKGHPYDEENTKPVLQRNGNMGRGCRECGRIASREAGRKRREKARNEQK